MVSLSDIILYLYPSADLSPFGNVQLADDGNGPYISRWDNALGSQPTQAQLDSALLPVSKIVQKQAIASSRYTAETAGITVNGAIIRTDRESQATLTGAWVVVQQNPIALIDWKAETGWVQIDRATVEALCSAVGAHVQAQFTRERLLCDQIDAAQTVEAVEATTW